MQDNKNRTVQPKSKPNHFGAYLLVPTYRRTRMLSICLLSIATQSCIERRSPCDGHRPVASIIGCHGGSCQER
jgi:hypothetical protein